MFDLSSVKVQCLAYGTDGTSSSVPTATGTNTSTPLNLPRTPYTVSVSAVTTGTSIGSGAVVWQVSNDQLGWIPLGSATTLSTNASTNTSANSAALPINVSTAMYAYGRAIVSGTGTSEAVARLSA